MPTPSQPLLRREGERHERRPSLGRRETPDPRHGGSRTRGPARAEARKRKSAGDRVPWHEAPARLIRYLPLSVLATLSVTVIPALAANALIPPHGVAGAAGAVLLAAVLSLAIAVSEAWGWRRVHAARGVFYGDLMIWGFLRRLWAEHRLKQVGATYRAAVGEDGPVRVELLEGLAHLLEIRNPYTYGHCRRVARHAERMAREMGLTAAQVAEIRTAALVHDVGKVYTPTEILHKRGPLDDEEFDIVKRHAADGADMLAPVHDLELASIVRHHHERIDGSGYPDGLFGPEIPLGSSIIAVADTFDAITSHRPYRRARSQREALAVLEAERGRLLDDGAVDAFLRSYSPRRSIVSIPLAGAISARIAAVFQLLPGGLLGGASIAAMLPAVGAAGVLALAPDARYERSAKATGASNAAALGTAFPGELQAQGAAPAPAAPRLRAGTGPVSRHTGAGRQGASVVVTPTPGTQGPGGTSQTGAGGSAPVTSGGGGQGTPPVSVGGKTEAPAVEVPEPPGVPPVKVPAVKVPSVETPSVEVPSVKAPPVSTPSVTTPQVSVGAVTVPSVTVPSVTVQLPATPVVKVPPVKLP
jgi:putative nucleotidyltransferase with HDIG domain